jgi:hypothetical protein
MADIRIKDLATTATTTASDDFMAVDGATNGTRKMNAAAPAFLTSVTTPSLTSPAGNNLTLGTGSFGTALTVASATGAATFAGAVTVSSSTAGSAGAGALVVSGGLATGAASYFGGAVTVNGTGSSSVATTTGFTWDTVPTAGFSVGAIGTGGSFMVQTPSLSSGFGSGLAIDGTYTSGKSVINLKAFGVKSGGPYSSDLAFYTSSTATSSELMRLNSAGNLLIGGTTDISGTGGLKVFGTTPSTNTTSGALVVTGGVGVGGALNVGGAVTAINTTPSTAQVVKIGTTGVGSNASPLTSTLKFTGYAGGDKAQIQASDRSSDFGGSDLVFSVTDNSATLFTALTLARNTGAATFASTVIAPAATTALAPMRIPHGTAPTSPVNGDMWTTTAGLFVRINGVTVGPLS